MKPALANMYFAMSLERVSNSYSMLGSSAIAMS